MYYLVWGRSGAYYVLYVLFIVFVLYDIMYFLTLVASLSAQQHNTSRNTACNTALHVFSKTQCVTHLRVCVIEHVLHTCVMQAKKSR